MSDNERHKYLADIGNHEEQEAVPEVTSTAIPLAEPVKAPAKKVVRKVVRKQAAPAAEYIPEPAAAATPAFIPEEEPLPVFTAETGSEPSYIPETEPLPVFTAETGSEPSYIPETEPLPVFTAEAGSEPSYIPEAEPIPVFTAEAGSEPSYIPEAEPAAVLTPEPEAAPEPVIPATPVMSAAPIETPAPIKVPAKKVVKKVVRKQAAPAAVFTPEPAAEPEPVMSAAPAVAEAPIETPAPAKAPAKKVVKKVVRKQTAPAAVLTPEPEAAPEPVITATPVVAAAPIETPAPAKVPAKKKVVKKVVRKQAVTASKPAPETAMQTATPSPASASEIQVNKEDDRGNGREFKQPIATFGNVAYRTETAASSPNVWNEEQREAYRQKEKERQAVEEEKEEEKPVKGFFKKKSKEKKTEDLDKKDKEKLSDIEASVSGAKEEQKQQTKNPKAVRNKVIVASTFSVMVAALATTTFIIPSFRFRDEMSALRKANVGDIVTYGKYKGNKEWIVLDRKDNRVLCISNYGVGDERADEVVLWETSPVREHLNSTFMNSAFNIFERVRIISTKEIRENEPDYRAEYVSPDVVDKMFMLKDEEVKEYIASNSDRMTQLSDISVHPACWIDIH
ncbi:MAG: DUF6273 domain-containing protein [Lachnospiraceae bacterium]|nr:DUF6273 domain-containing protein [Lachnospiraceae bacterium]